MHELYVYLNYTWQWKRLAIWRAQPPYAAPISIALPFLPSKAGTQRSRSVVKALSDALATASGVWIHIFESCVSVRTASVNCTDSTPTTVGVSRFGEGMGERREREKEERKRERERAREIQTQTQKRERARASERESERARKTRDGRWWGEGDCLSPWNVGKGISDISHICSVVIENSHMQVIATPQLHIEVVRIVCVIVVGLSSLTRCLGSHVFPLKKKMVRNSMDTPAEKQE